MRYVMITNDYKSKLRSRREKECFAVINRGLLWYDKLTKTQLNELYEWYNKWLDVTITGVVPAKPLWLNDKLNNQTEEILL